MLDLNNKAEMARHSLVGRVYVKQLYRIIGLENFPKLISAKRREWFKVWGKRMEENRDRKQSSNH